LRGKIERNEPLTPDERTRAARLGVQTTLQAPGAAAPAAPDGIEQLVAGEPDMRAGRGMGRNRAAEGPTQAEIAAAAAAAQQKADQTAPGAMEQGIASAVPMAFDPVKARAAQEKTIREGEAAALGDVDKEEARYDEFLKGLGLRGEAEEKRVRESLDSIKGEKNKAGYMALFQAGLSILSADPSRGGLAAIGEGALKGLGAYKGDIKDLEARRERMVDKLDTLDGLRRQEAIASEEGRRRIGQRRSQIRTEFGKEYRDMAKQFDIDIPLDAAKTLADQTFRSRLASMPSGEERILSALGDGDIAKGFERSKQLGAKPADLMGEFNDFLKANPMLATSSQEQQLQAFLRTRMMLNPPKVADKPTGQVRD